MIQSSKLWSTYLIPNDLSPQLASSASTVKVFGMDLSLIDSTSSIKFFLSTCPMGAYPLDLSRQFDKQWRH